MITQSLDNRITGPTGVGKTAVSNSLLVYKALTRGAIICSLSTMFVVHSCRLGLVYSHVQPKCRLRLAISME